MTQIQQSTLYILNRRVKTTYYVIKIVANNVSLTHVAFGDTILKNTLCIMTICETTMIYNNKIDSILKFSKCNSFRLSIAKLIQILWLIYFSAIWENRSLIKKCQGVVYLSYRYVFFTVPNRFYLYNQSWHLWWWTLNHWVLNQQK